MIDVLSNIWQPAHFYVGPGLRCAWQFEAEQTLPWELFRGQLVFPTREQRTFLTWNILPVLDGELGEPVLSLLLDGHSVHVTRGFECHVWKPVDSTDGIDAEEATQWTRELVGSVPKDDANLGSEIQTLIRHAIVGCSRLPLTSLEAPHPLFTLGRFMYHPRPLDGMDPARPQRLLQDLFPVAGDAKILETVLRQPVHGSEQMATLSEILTAEPDFPATFRRMFNEVSLSPYTDFVDRTLAVLAEHAEEPEILSWLARRITRHLTAYDLVLFHYRGANYPDALLLDAILRRPMWHDSSRRVSFTPLTRRAFRMTCLVRASYEGHRVPPQPTSPGESLRVLPGSSESSPAADRELYADAPLAGVLTPSSRQLLRDAMLDLASDAELREGGIALFIDRPLGFFKAPAEVDRTPLLSYVCFSRRLATRRLIECERLSSKLDLGIAANFWEARRRRLAELNVAGLSLDRIPDSPRPAVSLADARKVSDDFVILRTTPGSLHDFWSALGITPGDWPLVARVVHQDRPVLAAFDRSHNAAWLFEGDWSAGSRFRAGIETPRAGVVAVQ